ncbi:MAG: AAA family ATPase [Candidatus Aenigmatarchaeota archaeon]
MILKFIKLKNIRSYIDEKIEFPRGSVLLSGDVGSGKSTILLAADFALFGIRKGELDGTNLLRHDKNHGSVELEFELDGKNIIVKRVLKRNKGVVQDSGVLMINGIEREFSPTELTEKIYELLGYPRDAIKKNRPIFRYTVYTPQEEMKTILLSKERIEVLRKIFGIDKYGIIRNNARMFLTELRSIKKMLDISIADLENKLLELEKIEKEKIDAEKKLIEQNKILEDVNKRLEIKKSEMNIAKEEIEKLNKISREVIHYESELSIKERRLKTIIIDIEDVNTKIKLYQDELRKFMVTGYINDLKNELSEMQKKKSDAISVYGAIKKEIEKLNEILKNGVCGVCGQKVYNKDEFNNRIENKINECKEIEKNISDMEKKIEKILENIYSLEKKSQIEKTINDYINWMKKLEVEKSSIKNDIDELNKKILSLKPMLESYSKIEIKYKSLEGELDKINNEKLFVEKNISRTEEQLKHMHEMISNLKKEIENKKKEKDRSYYIGELINWIDEHFINLMETIEKHVMYSIQQEFNKFFKEWFTILMGDELNVRIDEQFTPIIEQNGYETEYANLSGGERTSVALAYRLALNKVVNILLEGIKTKDLLILDEPTDGFSTDQLERMRDVIEKLNLKQIIIVSHEPKIDTFVENTIKVYKEGHVSRISR